MASLVLAMPVRKDSLPFALIAVQPQEPNIDGKSATRSEDGTVWVNAGNNSLLAKVNANKTLQELGTGEFLTIGPNSELLVQNTTSEASPNFVIDNQTLEYLGRKQSLVACEKYNQEYQLYWARDDEFKCADDTGEDSKMVHVSLRTVALNQKPQHQGYNATTTEAPVVANATATDARRHQQKDVSLVVPIEAEVDATLTLAKGGLGNIQATVLDHKSSVVDAKPTAGGGNAATMVEKPPKTTMGQTGPAPPRTNAPGEPSTTKVVLVDPHGSIVKIGSSTVNPPIPVSSPHGQAPWRNEATRALPEGYFNNEKDVVHKTRTKVPQGTITLGTPAHQPTVTRVILGASVATDPEATFREVIATVTADRPAHHAKRGDDVATTINLDDAVMFNKRETPQRLGPMLMPVQRDHPNQMYPTNFTGHVELVNGTQSVETFAVFDVPQHSNHTGCHLEFEMAKPVYMPSMRGAKSFEVWDLESSVPEYGLTYSKRPRSRRVVGTFDNGEFKSTGPIDCAPGKKVGLSLKADQKHQNSYVGWLQHENCGLHLVLDN